MRFPEIQQLWKMTKTAISICGFLLLFFIGIELLRAYQALHTFHPLFGQLFGIGVLLLIVWFAVWMWRQFASLPKVLAPPKVRDFDNPLPKEANKYSKYLIRYMDRLSQNKNLTEEVRGTVKESLCNLQSALNNKSSLVVMTEQMRLAELKGVEPALEMLKKKSEKEIWSSVQHVGVLVAVSPFHALDLIIVFHGNVKMVIRIMGIFEGRPAFLGIIHTLRDVGCVMATVSFFNISQRVIEKAAQAGAKFIPVVGSALGSCADEIVQGISAATITGVVGNATVHRCSVFSKRWELEDATVDIKQKMGHLHELVGSLIRSKLIPQLRKRKQDISQDISEEDNAKQNAFWENLSGKVGEAFEDTRDFAISCVDVTVRTGTAAQQGTFKTAKIASGTFLHVGKGAWKGMQSVCSKLGDISVRTAKGAGRTAKGTGKVIKTFSISVRSTVSKNSKETSNLLRRVSHNITQNVPWAKKHT